MEKETGISKDISCLLRKPLVLVGMMGCGKSHIGRVLAKGLGVPFYDSDSIIEKEQGRSISAIFEIEGEAFFRALEREKITALLAGPVCVISTGGGAVTTPEVLTDIKERGISIWLNTDEQILLRRLKNGTGKRPLLANEDLEGMLRGLLKKRKPLYAQADIVLDNSQDDVHNMIENIIVAVENFVKSETEI